MSNLGAEDPIETFSLLKADVTRTMPDPFAPSLPDQGLRVGNGAQGPGDWGQGWANGIHASNRESECSGKTGCPHEALQERVWSGTWGVVGR